MFHFWGMPVLWIIWIPVAIVMFLLIIKLSEDARSQLGNKDTPLEILRRRYANGEISTDEFQERQRVLESNQ